MDRSSLEKAILEYSRHIDNTLSALIKSQKELRRMVMDFNAQRTSTSSLSSNGLQKKPTVVESFRDGKEDVEVITLSSDEDSEIISASSLEDSDTEEMTASREPDLGQEASRNIVAAEVTPKSEALSLWKVCCYFPNVPRRSS
uniref:ING domain-containing protein n=1 Tax=Steinernema glaseri TaxID=37863 RepID=A0A1I7YV74_9BILA